MNLDDLTSNSTSSIRRVTLSSSHDDPPELREQSNTTLNLRSYRPDSDWVSPFTLPPLPPFRRSRTQSGIYKSPEQSRKRAGSGDYYAAAWGSPYATPSPRRPSPKPPSPGPVKSDLSPPQYSWHSVLRTDSSESLRSYLRQNQSRIASSAPNPVTAERVIQKQSERNNWLSGSEDSDGEDEVTPRGQDCLDSWGTLPPPQDNEVVVLSGHRTRASNETITPETFAEAHEVVVVDEKLWYTDVSVEPDQLITSTASADATSEMVEKPLPEPPRRVSDVGTLANKAESPKSPSRPRIGSTQSYQLSKKKVVWKGKTCIIALPLTDRESAGLPPLLTADEVKAKVDALIAEGYNIDGFELGESYGSIVGHGTAQSRPSHPDPSDLMEDRKLRTFQVHIPDHEEWNAWVDYLKEEKLRALGVTPSNSEPLPHRRSPFSISISRSSSRFPGSGVSPPIPGSSAASNPLRATSNPFSPVLNGSLGMTSNFSSRASSHYNGSFGPIHTHKQSIVVPSRTSSLYDHSNLQVFPAGSLVRTSSYGFGQRGFSPVNPAEMQKLSQMVSPDPILPKSHLQHQASTFTAPTKGIGVNGHTDRLVEQQTHLTPAPETQRSSDLPSTPLIENSSRPALEIAHPTPRSHRHNLSAALQKEIENADSVWKSSPSFASAAKERSYDLAGIIDETNEEEDQDELPILKRPEVVDDEAQMSDVETNPSISASPMLTDDKSPFADVQPSVKVKKMKPDISHKAKPSIFNAAAPAFDPHARFSSSNFASNTGFVPFASSVRHSSAPAKPAPTRKISVGHLNVGAPTFTPGGLPKVAEDSTAFTFSSTNLDVTAPAFNPSSSSNVQPLVVELARSTNSIFDPVIIDSEAKPTRRTSKALPIVRPRSKDGPVASDAEHLDVEEPDGRPTAPIERQKRAKRFGSDGDRSPVFAESAPFNHARILSEIMDDAESHSNDAEMVREKPVDGWAYIPAEEHLSGPDTSVQDSGHLDGHLDEDHKLLVFQKEGEAVLFNEARAGPHTTDLNTPLPQQLSHKSSQGSMSRQKGSMSHKPRSSLSALAKPFEWKARSQSRADVVTSAAPQELSDSEAATSIAKHSKMTSPPAHLAKRLSSPLQQPYEYIRSEDEPSIRGLENVTQENDRQSGGFIEHRPTTAESDEILSDTEDLPVEEVIDEVNPPELSNDDEDLMPSFEEIDAVMKQFEDNPELGIERNDTPIQSTPLVDMGLGHNFRSDAPSPSPRRAAQCSGIEAGSSASATYGLGIGVKQLGSAKEQVSDWNDTLSAADEEKLQMRSQFFDSHVNNLVDGILGNRLGPLERRLETIQHNLGLLAARPTSKSGRRSISTEVKESDADDEDDTVAEEALSLYRTRSSPSRRTRKNDNIRIAVGEALATYMGKQQQPPPSADTSNIHAILSEVKTLIQGMPAQEPQHDIKTVVEDVISNHPKLRGSRVRNDHEAHESKYQLQIDGLESMLRNADLRADDEAEKRRTAEAEIVDLKSRLAAAMEQSVLHREASEQAQKSIHTFLKEKRVHQDLQEDTEKLKTLNEALQNTLDEYRITSDQLRDDVREERAKNRESSRALTDLQEQLQERSHSRQMLRSKVERLQGQMSQVVHDLSSEQTEWHKKEREMLTAKITAQSALDTEIRRRQGLETEFDDLRRQYHEKLQYQDRFEMSHREVTKLQQSVISLQDENRTHKDNVFKLEREVESLRTSKETELVTATAVLKAELESRESRLQSLRNDSEAQIQRLQSRLDDVEIDLEEQKAKHDSIMTETADAHTQAMRELAEKRDAALEEQHANHDKKLTDLRERHTRALHNSSDDRHRLEFQLNEKLTMSEDKVKHLENKLEDLDERLQITKSAARAAVEAAMTKNGSLPTPAPSVVASPPQRTASASLTIIKSNDIPEKISPQALRESILVLQEQLQTREQKIESLEAELASVDKEAPNKIKDRDTEISWLRELIGVRVDDLEEIIETLSKDDFDKDTVKDAAIRLRANLQMQQHLKYRATDTISTLPSMTSLAAYAQSPGSLPMAAVAALGNWRKARDTSMGALSDLATNLSNQTPSKSTISSPASFLSSIMTPPNTQQRPTSEDSIPTPAMRPLAAAAAARRANMEARPLRPYNTQFRTLSSRQVDKRPGAITRSTEPLTRSISPHTPIAVRSSLDLGDDVDEDASPYDAREVDSADGVTTNS